MEYNICGICTCDVIFPLFYRPKLMWFTHGEITQTYIYVWGPYSITLLFKHTLSQLTDWSTRWSYLLLAVQLHTEQRVLVPHVIYIFCGLYIFILSNTSTMDYLFQIIATSFVSNSYFGLFEPSKHLPIELRHSLILPTALYNP